MKHKVQECRYCKEETDFRVRKVCFKPHGKGSHGGIKYTVEHCTQCNRKWYNGKLKGQRELEKQQPKQPRKISLR